MGLDSYIHAHIVPPLGRYFHARGWTPNMVTTLRLLLNILIIYCLLKRVFVAVPVMLVVISQILDDVDGMMARTYDQCSTFGKYFDGSVDSLLFLTIIYFLFVTRSSTMPRPVYIAMIVIYVIFVAQALFASKIKSQVLDAALFPFHALVIYTASIIIIYIYAQK